MAIPRMAGGGEVGRNDGYLTGDGVELGHGVGLGWWVGRDGFGN